MKFNIMMLGAVVGVVTCSMGYAAGASGVDVCISVAGTQTDATCPKGYAKEVRAGAADKCLGTYSTSKSDYTCAGGYVLASQDAFGYTAWYCKLNKKPAPAYASPSCPSGSIVHVIDTKFNSVVCWLTSGQKDVSCGSLVQK